MRMRRIFVSVVVLALVGSGLVGIVISQRLRGLYSSGRSRGTDALVVNGIPIPAPNGSSVAFVVAKRDQQGGSLQEVRFENKVIGTYPSVHGPHWNTDSTLLSFVVTRQGDGQGSVFQYDTQSGTVSETPSGGEIADGGASPDGKHVWYYSPTDGQQYFLYLDERKIGPLRSPAPLVWATDGQTFAYNHCVLPGPECRFLVRDVQGDVVRDLGPGVEQVAFAPDGSVGAYTKKVGSKRAVIEKSRTHPPHDQIRHLKISPKGEVVYIAVDGGKQRAVVGERESKEYDWIVNSGTDTAGSINTGIVTNENGSSYAFAACQKESGKKVLEKRCLIVRDGQESDLMEPYTSFFDIALTPRGNRLVYQKTVESPYYRLLSRFDPFEGWSAFFVGSATAKYQIVIDREVVATHRGTPFVSPPIFAEDGNRFSYFVQSAGGVQRYTIDLPIE